VLTGINAYLAPRCSPLRILTGLPSWLALPSPLWGSGTAALEQHTACFPTWAERIERLAALSWHHALPLCILYSTLLSAKLPADLSTSVTRWTAANNVRGSAVIVDLYYASQR